MEESTSSNLLTETLNLQPSFAIRQILQGTTQGKEIVHSLEEKRSIISKQRKQLVRLLVSHLLETNGETPSTDTKKALAVALMYEFPCLLDGTGSGYGAWYTPGRNHKPATGFLEERLRNVRKRMRMLKRPRHQEQQKEQTVPSTPEYDVPPEKRIEMVLWMKVNRYPVSQVEDYMNQTALHRGKWIRSNGSKSLPEILTEFPRLLDNPGMISQDFQQREGRLPLVFDDMPPDQALKVLPTLLPPSVYRNGGKVHRPTVEESRKSFINIQPVGTNMPRLWSPPLHHSQLSSRQAYWLRL
ncbi:hypothetical protein CgunFtcFv8_011330 [Champsocephalus gunnari]|uniref:Uncharacterized protein n=1 Tax=Champsocephalus gunnari TaxID=52237 RepID=A0AAN8D6P3_CHAGU|nr:hypothetical protein CgunFtcFv8_011330 [Champsocephalus gunnari]